MQDLYEKIQNHSPQIVFNKYNHELVREKPYRLAWAGQSRRTCHGSTTNTCRSQRHLRIEHQPRIFPRQINAIPLPKEWVHFPTNSSLKIQARTRERETIALPERGKLEELAMAPLPAPQKGNHNCNMIIFEKNKITEYVHLSECFMGQSCFHILAMKCVNHPRFTRSYRALSPKHYLDTLEIRTISKAKYTRTVIQDLLITYIHLYDLAAWYQDRKVV